MTKTLIKPIALNANRQLNVVAKDVYNRDLVTTINHDQLEGQLPQKFLDAFDHYKKIAQLHGENHPLAEEALLVTMEQAPTWLKEQISNDYLPKPIRHLKDGTPVYDLEDIAKKLGIPTNQAEKQLAEILQQRKMLGLKNKIVLLKPKSVKRCIRRIG